MKKLRAVGLALASVLFVSLTSWAQTYKAEAIGAPPADVPKAIQDALQPEGVRITSDQGAVVCEIWLRKGTPLNQGATGSADVLYPGLSTGELVGVFHFPNQGTDFRGQTIKAGYYTLRYAQIPQDGNHMGVSQYRDFLLLGPTAADTDVSKNMSVPDVLKLSRQASGTGHPAILSMVPLQGQGSPNLVKDDQGHWVYQGKVGGTGGDLPIAVIVVGQYQGG